jgi:hypothetical protein
MTAKSFNVRTYTLSATMFIYCFILLWRGTSHINSKTLRTKELEKFATEEASGLTVTKHVILQFWTQHKFICVYTYSILLAARYSKIFKVTNGGFHDIYNSDLERTHVEAFLTELFKLDEIHIKYIMYPTHNTQNMLCITLIVEPPVPNCAHIRWALLRLSHGKQKAPVTSILRYDVFHKNNIKIIPLYSID